MAAEPAPPPSFDSALVVTVIDAFLDYVEKHRSADTYRWYKDRPNGSCRSIPSDLTVKALKPFHVQKWVDSQPSKPKFPPPGNGVVAQLLLRQPTKRQQRLLPYRGSSRFLHRRSRVLQQGVVGERKGLVPHR